jgi:hypothetical protein
VFIDEHPDSLEFVSFWVSDWTMEGIGSACGAYHYSSLNHWLEVRTRWDGPAAAGFHVALTSIPWRESWQCGERAFRYCQHDMDRQRMRDPSRDASPRA